MPPKFLPLLLAAALTIAACTPMGGRDGPPPGGTGGDDGGPPSVTAQLQEQLQRTATALRLTPPQAVLWDAYQDKIGALMADQMKLQTPRSVRQSAPQQIILKVDMVRNRLTAMEDIQEAAHKLYAGLDDEQKKIADQSLAATIPALYSGLCENGSRAAGRAGERPSRRGAPGGGMGGPGGGMGGGGFGGM
ncbi:MAG: hypothetical protein H6R15_1846 [Proteobacteria bacterium]|nr:hypothetical protein [Pseudomonadota bacterium]